MKDQWKKWREKMLSLWQGKTGKAAAGLAFAVVACLGLLWCFHLWRKKVAAMTVWRS